MPARIHQFRPPAPAWKVTVMVRRADGSRTVIGEGVVCDMDEGRRYATQTLSAASIEPEAYVWALLQAGQSGVNTWEAAEPPQRYIATQTDDPGPRGLGVWVPGSPKAEEV